MYSQRALIAAAVACTLALGCERSSPTVAHNISGPIASIDHEKAIVEIAAEPATLRLPLASGSTRDLVEGDVITARLVLAQGTEPAERAYDAPAQPGEPGQPDEIKPMVHAGQHSVTGKILQINHDTGVFNVRAGEETLTFYFPPDRVRDLEAGEQITVLVGFTKAG